METPRSGISSEKNIISLNRTMQYGNYFFKKRTRKVIKFKSYYVVWKQFPDEFLSTNFAPFKSYYVVWKLKKTEKQRITQKSLNRTMQYGNFCGSSGRGHKKRFKSYYVVWKLLFLTTLCFNTVGFKSYYVVWKRRE